MVDVIDKLYTRIVDRHALLARLRYYSLLRIVVRTVANLVIPAFYLCTSNDSRSRLSGSGKHGRRVVVSLTSFPLRIGKVWIVVESLLRQTVKPDFIILWLSRDQFTSLDELPKRLLNQQKKGLTIRFCDGDLKSHKKYFYSITEYPEDNVITVDDDIIYRTTLIAELLDLHSANPGAICCHRGHLIRRNDGEILKYVEWLPLTRSMGRSKNIFPTSGGGSLYPPHSLHENVLNSKVFMEISMYADDVWLYCMGRLKGTEVVKSNYTSACLPVLYSRNQRLSDGNVGMHENDVQLAAVRRYCIDTFQIDVCSAPSGEFSGDGG